MLHGTIGRLPLIKRHLDKHLDEAQAYVRRRQGGAVFFGRFTTALRVLVPGLAGMSDVHYPTFLAYNVAGGVLRGTGFALLGYVAGASWRHVARIAGQFGLALLGLIVLALILGPRDPQARAPVGTRACISGSEWPPASRPCGCAAGSPLRSVAPPTARHLGPPGVRAHVLPRRGGVVPLVVRWAHPGRGRARRRVPCRSSRAELGRGSPNGCGDLVLHGGDVARFDRPSVPGARPLRRHSLVAPKGVAAERAPGGGAPWGGRPLRHREADRRPGSATGPVLDRDLLGVGIPLRPCDAVDRVLRNAGLPPFGAAIGSGESLVVDRRR